MYVKLRIIIFVYIISKSEWTNVTVEWTNNKSFIGDCTDIWMNEFRIYDNSTDILGMRNDMSVFIQ